MLCDTNHKTIYGAYLLFINLTTKTILPNLFNTSLLPGYYGYAGNARGKGGVQGRCKRHFKSMKKKHWHVDWLTTNAQKLFAIAFPDKNECEIIQYLLTIKGTSVVIEGFGSSDCKICLSHLIKFPNNFSMQSIKLPSVTLNLIQEK
jgi:Uri superfamily endonuclease|tara:strand:- start:418 stop:858 length:441 start_codon:yes stop_codon:yes gene_type:complete